MASQPLNTNIQVFRRVRAQREWLRFDSIKNVVGHLRSLILMVPGEELRTQAGIRDTAVTDFSAYMGQASPEATRGLPFVINIRAAKDFNVVNSMTTIDFPIQIGQDKFIQETAANVGGDLFAQASAAV